MSHASTSFGFAERNVVVREVIVESSCSRFFVCSKFEVYIAVIPSSTFIAVGVKGYVIALLSYSAFMLEKVETSFVVLFSSFSIKDDGKVLLKSFARKSF